MVWVQAGTLWPALGHSVPTSPCPTIFWYEVDASSNSSVRVKIPAPPAGSSLRTVADLVIDAAVDPVSRNYPELHEASI
jgi:hypothetical protein